MLQNRMASELRMLERDPPPGVCASPVGDSIVKLHALITGPEGSVYERGTFKLSVSVPERYPFEPPSIQFLTPIMHPNIDFQGRICLDILNMPPKGGWKPALNISTLLTSIRLLLAEPNPDDGLVQDLTAEFKYNRQAFDIKARQYTRQHAMASDQPQAHCTERDQAADVLRADSGQKLAASCHGEPDSDLNPSAAVSRRAPAASGPSELPGSNPSWSRCSEPSPRGGVALVGTHTGSRGEQPASAAFPPAAEAAGSARAGTMQATASGAPHDQTPHNMATGSTGAVAPAAPAAGVAAAGHSGSAHPPAASRLAPAAAGKRPSRLAMCRPAIGDCDGADGDPALKRSKP